MGVTVLLEDSNGRLLEEKCFMMSPDGRLGRGTCEWLKRIASHRRTSQHYTVANLLSIGSSSWVCSQAYFQDRRCIPHRWVTVVV
jgi:hypothetical protein